MTIAEKLRTETRSLHGEVEGLMNASRIMDHSLTLDEYELMLSHNYQFHAPLEKELLEREYFLQHYNLHERLKAPLLLQDFSELSILPPFFENHFHEWSDAKLMGACYVAEGSTLGGQLISKQLLKNESITATTRRFRFFNGYAQRTGERWKQFIDFLEAYGDKEEEQVVEGAKHAFQIFGKLLTRHDGTNKA